MIFFFAKKEFCYYVIAMTDKNSCDTKAASSHVGAFNKIVNE